MNQLGRSPGRPDLPSGRLSRAEGQPTLFNNHLVPGGTVPDPPDTAARRKSRGAFFTPAEITRFIAGWAVRSADDRVFEPSAGDAAFLVAAVDRLRRLSESPQVRPRVDGVEIHPASARMARRRVREAGGDLRIRTEDFLAVEADPGFDCVIGNPPFIRFHEFAGPARDQARRAAARAGVPLTRLASSWAAFTVHAVGFLAPGGRLGLVLPAELLSVNYAAPIRRFLLDRFRSVDLVLFDERVFPDAEADVVLVLAEGHRAGPSERLGVRRAVSAAGLAELAAATTWTPEDSAGKWTGILVPASADQPLRDSVRAGHFTRLEAWGDTTLGMVTGNNRYFTLSPQRVAELGLPSEELLTISPAGSAHLRGLRLDEQLLTRLGREGKAIHLFRPGPEPSAAARAYLATGLDAEIDRAYKCRVRKQWHQVPLVPPADLLLTCMNADTPRLTTNVAGAHHLNSVHGVYLQADVAELGRELLPLASLNSITLLHAEMVGRSYGGGILKLEPREADSWTVPSPALVGGCAEALRPLADKMVELLGQGRLLDAVELVDQVVLVDAGVLRPADLDQVRQARAELVRRRTARGARAR